MKSIYQLCRCIAMAALLMWLLFHMAGDAHAQTNLGQCVKPADLQTDMVTEHTAQLLWQSKGAGDEYEVEIRSMGRTPSFVKTKISSETQVAIEGLIPGSKYRFRVATRCGSARSGFTKWRTFTTSGMSPHESCGKAENPEAKAYSMTTVSLSWTGSGFSTHYEVEVKSRGKQTPFYYFNKSLVDTSITITGLIPLGKYKFRIRSTCENGAVSGATSWYKFQLDDQIMPDTCATISQFEIDSVTSSSVFFSWNQVNPEAKFTLNLGKDSSLIKVIHGVSNHASLDSLDPATDYYLTLIDSCPDGISSQISVLFKTDSIVVECDSIVRLDAIPVDSSRYSLSWDSVDGSGYHVQVADRDTMKADLYADSVVSDAMLLFAALDSVEEYRFRVRALCSMDAEGAFSQWFGFPIEADSLASLVCEPPAEFRIDSVVGEDSYLSWKGSDTIRYQIQVRTQDTSWSFVMEADSNYIFLMLADLDSATAYEVRVRSLCGNEESSPYTEWLDFETPAIVTCTEPAKLSAATENDSTVKLSWQPSATAISYRVFVALEDTTSQILLDLQTADTMLLVSGLEGETLYRFRLISVCDTGDTSNYTDWSLFQISDTTFQCPAPEQVQVDSLNTHEVWISWNETDADYYRIVLMDQDTGSMKETVYTTDDPELHADSLLPMTEYRYYLQSVCQGLRGEPTDTSVFITLGEEQSDTCFAPEDFVLDSVDVNEAWISWSSVDTGHFIFSVFTPDSQDYYFEEGEIMESRIKLVDLPPGEDFSLSVRSLCSEFDTSEWSEPFLFQTLHIPIDPVDSCSVPIPVLQDITDSTATVEWTPASDSAFYLLEVENIGLTPSFQLVTTTRDTMFQLEGLVAGGSYQWKVVAFCHGYLISDCSPWMIIQAEGPLEPTCPSPTGLSATLNDQGDMTLSWDETDDILDYEVEVQSIDSTPFYGLSSIVAENELVLDDLAAGGFYEFKVNAQCLDGTISEDSDWFFFVVNPADTAVVLGSSSTYRQMAYPNPVRSILRIAVPEELFDQDLSVDIRDMMGRSVLRKKGQHIDEGDILSFEVGEIRDGIYKLAVTSEAYQFYDLVFISTHSLK